MLVELNENLKIVEKTFKVKIFQNGNKISISGDDEENTKELRMQSKIYMHQHLMELSYQRNKYRWQLIKMIDLNSMPTSEDMKDQIIKTPKKIIKPRGRNQNSYISNMSEF